MKTMRHLMACSARTANVRYWKWPGIFLSNLPKAFPCVSRWKTRTALFVFPIFMLTSFAIAEDADSKAAAEALKAAHGDVEKKLKALKGRIEQVEKLEKLLKALDRPLLDDTPPGEEWYQLAADVLKIEGGELTADVVKDLRGLKSQLEKQKVFEHLEHLKNATKKIEEGLKTVKKAQDYYDLVMLFEPEKGGPAAAFDRFAKVISGPVSEYGKKIPGLGHMIKFYSDACTEFSIAFHKLEKAIAESRQALCNMGQVPKYLTFRDHYNGLDRCRGEPFLRGLFPVLHPIRVYEGGSGKADRYLYMYARDFPWQGAKDAAHCMIRATDFNNLLRHYTLLRIERPPFVSLGEFERRMHPVGFMVRARHHGRAAGRVAELDGAFEEWYRMLGKNCFQNMLLLGGEIEGTGASRVIQGHAFAYPLANTRSTGTRNQNEFIALCHFFQPFHDEIKTLINKYENMGLVQGAIRASDGELLKEAWVRVNGVPAMLLEPYVHKGEAHPGVFRYAHIAEAGGKLTIEAGAEGYKPLTREIAMKRKSPDGDCNNLQHFELVPSDDLQRLRFVVPYSYSAWPVAINMGGDFKINVTGAEADAVRFEHKKDQMNANNPNYRVHVYVPIGATVHLSGTLYIRPDQTSGTWPGGNSEDHSSWGLKVDAKSEAIPESASSVKRADGNAVYFDHQVAVHGPGSNGGCYLLHMGDFLTTRTIRGRNESPARTGYRPSVSVVVHGE